MAEIESVPTAVVAMFVEQLAEAPVPVSTQTPTGVKVRFPAGVLVMPGDMSVTVAEQVVSSPTVGVDRAQVTTVEVSRLLILTSTEGLMLGRCPASPP